MATYGTDLTTLTNAESGTWVELTNYAAGGTPSADTENYIQGAGCYSQSTGTKSGAQFSVVYNNGSGITWTTGDVFLVWQYYSTGANLATYANGGMRIAIYSGLTTGDMFYTGGSDRAPYPDGAWQNVAVDPENTTNEVTEGGGNGGTYQYIGSAGNFTAAIGKGSPHACDAIRYGRGEIYVTGTGANFTDMAQYNDYNDATNGYNRFGLFTNTGGGTFRWKGLMSLGQSGTSVTFSDSNKTIVIEDAAKTYASFNKIAVRNASSSVTWNNISFFALGTVAPGDFEMPENGTVSKTSCGFNNMGAFSYGTNATITRCSYNGCKQVSHGGADFDSCSFAGYEGTAGTAYMTYAVATDPDGEIDNCSFTKGTAATHAIEFDATNTPTTITLRGINFSGYNAANGNNDSTLYFPSTSKSYTVNLIGCSGNISYRVGAGGSVTLVTNPVTFQATVKDIDTSAVIEGARVFAEVSNGVNFPYQASVSITGANTTEDSYAGSQDNTLDLNDTYKSYCQVFQATNSKKVTACTFEIWRVNSPTGKFTAKLYAITGTPGTNAKPTGTALATSHEYDAATLSASAWNVHTFQFGNTEQYQLTSGTWYAIAVDYQDGDATNRLRMGRDFTTPTHAGNPAYYSAGAWTSVTTYDWNFAVYSDGVATVSHATHGLSTNDFIAIRGANEDVYNGQYQITVTGAGTYTYQTTEAPLVTPATGTITATFVLLSGLTNASGVISASRTYSNDQPFIGKVRKATTGKLYKEQPLSDTIDNSNGLQLTVLLASDE